MAELYDQNKIYANRPTASSQAPQSADAELEAMLAELPPEERETARAKITAPPTGEDIYKVMQERNANGEVFNMNLDQYRQYKAYVKTKEVDILDAMGTAAEGVFNEIMAAAGSIADKPLESTAKLTPSLIEAFAQGTRSLYGMAAQSQDPNSVFFRVKNAITANGDDEQAEFQQFMDAQAFNVHSMRLATGQDTILMDKDIINPEMTQVMSYIADPTLFVPFGGIAAKGARMIGMGEGLAKASARAAQIQRKVLGGAIKWGVGAPIEFLGTATRNTIDYGLERAGAAFEVATGMPMAEAQATAKMYGLQTASAALEGRTVGLPIVGDIAGAMVGSTTARGVGEALTMVGEQMQKQQQFGRGILSYAGQALRDANKSGVPLSKHAKALLNVIDKADPLFVYSADISKGAAEGMVIGGILGGLSGGEEGAASGAGAGMALGAAGAGMGSVVSDIGNGRLYDRIAVQRQMVIEGLRQVDPQKAAAFEALVKTAEINGNRDVIAQIDGIITGIDVMAPDAKVVVRDADAHIEWLRSQKIDPKTGRLMEPLALFPEFGTDRKSRAKALSFLSMLGNRFDGDHKLLIKELQGLPQDHALRKQFMRLSEEQKKSVFDAIDKAATPEFKEKFGGKNGYEFYGDLNYAEANVARVNAMFDAGNKTQANEMIRQFLKDETGKDGKLTNRGELLKQKLATEGYFDKDGNMRPSRLKDVEMTAKEFKNAKGFVFRRDSTGQVELHINLKEFGKETLPHELFHAVMLDSVLKPDFIDRLSQNLLGKFDADGKRIENASVDIKQVRQFFQRYIDALHGKNSQDAVNETARLEAAMKEYESRGTTNKIALDTKNTLEGLLEEFGAYYFGAFINDKPVDFLFRGGELGAMREIMGNAKQGFLDFWRSKIKGMNPDFNFDPATNQFIFQAFEKEGVRTKNKSLDLLMRDFVRATAMANKQGGFDVSRLSPAARETFIKNNGIRGLSMTRDANGNLVRSPQRKVIQEQMRVGKEIYKILSGLDPKFRQGLITDGEGNLSGRLSPEAMEAMVQSGHIDRAWVDKIQQAYNILDGKGGNVIHFGYLGRTAQIGDYAWPRLVGSDVPFKNRQAVLLGVDFKVGKDGKMYSLFHTLDKAVIDGRADVLWSDSAVRTLWNGDRGAMEADFFRYLANASKAAGDSSRVESAVLLEDGTGAGARRRDVLHQMLGIVKAEGDMYINKPIAEIPYGIRHSVTTFNVDGIANMRVGTDRWNVVPENAFKDLSRNFQPSEMAREDTPNGAIIKHPLGYKFAEKNGKVRAFDKNGNSIGVFDGIEQASEAAKKYEGKLQVMREQFTEEVRQEQDKKMARFQPIEDATRRQALQPDGDLFSTEEVKAFTQGTRVIKQTQQEFVAQYVQEMLKPENKAKLTELIEQSFDKFRELREIEKQLNAEMEQLTWDSKSNQEELKIIQGKIIELIEERKKNPNSPDNSIIEYLGKNLQRKEELIKRSGEIIRELEAQGITDRSSEYYKTKMAYESYEQGKLSPEVAAVFLESQMQKVYNDQYATGVPVTFVANHGTPNYELIATKMFDVTRLGENTGSASAKRATFFAGSDKTAINYVGVPLEPNWINHPDYAWYFDWDRIKKTIERNYSNADLVIQNTEALFNEVKSRLQHHDTSKGAKNEIEKILAPLEEKSRTGEILNLSTEWLGRLSNHMVDVGTTFGGYEMDWKDAGRPPHLMRQLVKMNNPFVFEYRRADFRDVTFNEVIMKATEAGHDGVIFKNARDGGGTDIIYALISNTPNEAIKVFDTAHDSNAVNRGLDENGNKIMNGRELGLMHQPTEDWSTEKAIKARENQPRELWAYPNTENFKKWAGKLKFIGNEEDANKGVNYDKGFVTTVFKGVSVRSFDKFSERSKVQLGERPVNTDPNFFIADETAAERYAGGGYFDVSSLNEDAQKAASRGKADMYYIKSNKPANLLNAHKLEARNPRLYEVINRFWENNIKEDGHSILDPRTRIDRFLLEISMGNWLSPRNEITTTSPFGQPWRMDNWIKFHEHLLNNGYDSVVILDNSVSKKAPTIVVPQETANVKGSSNYGEFSRKDTRYNFQPKEDDYQGGRVYDQNSNEFKFNFIGKQAEENQDLIQGKNLEFVKRKDGSYRITLTDNGEGYDTRKIGHITATIDDASVVAGEGAAEISSNIDPKYRGQKLANILYSEMAERLRSMGIKYVDGTIVNKDGIPVQVRNTVIGQTYYKGSNKPAFREDAAKRIQAVQSVYPSKGVGVYNELDPKARYQPTEGGRTYTPEQMSGKFIGRYAEENKNITKGKSIYFIKDKAKGLNGGQTYRLGIRNKNELFGFINVEVKGDEAYVEYANVNILKGGRGYGNLMYSEMVERLRSMGVKEFSGSIVDEQGRPQKIRKRIIDQENKRIGKQADTVFDDSDENRVLATSYLNKEARYQPTENINTVVTRNLNDILRTTGGAYHTHNITGLIEQYIHRFKNGDIGEIARYVELKEEHNRLDRALSDSEDYYNSLSEEDTINPPDDAPNLPEDIRDEMTPIMDEMNDLENSISTSIEDDSSTSFSDLVTLYEQANELQKHAEKVRKSSKGFQYWDSFKERFLKSENEEVFAGVERVLRDNEASKLPKLFVSELYSGHSSSGETKGLVVDILKQEGKLNKDGLTYGSTINPQRLINLLRNKAGSGNKAFTEAQAIGFIDWLKLRMGGVDEDIAGGINLAQPKWGRADMADRRSQLNLKGKQNTIPTREVIDWLDKNQLDVRVDRKPVPNVESNNYVAGGETEGYRDLVIRMPERYSHGVEGHFGAGKTNVVAHVRVTFRRDAEGKRVMHIEEIQANNANVDVLPPKERETYKQVLKELAQAQLNYEAKSVSDVGYFNLKTKADKEAVGAVTAKSIEEGKPYGGKPVEDAKRLVNREKQRIEDDFQDKSRWANLSFKKFEEYVNADFQKKYPDVTKYLRHIYDRQMAEAEWRLEAKKSLEKTKLWNNEPEQLSDVDPKTGIKYPAISEIGRLRSEIQSASEKEGNKAPLQDPKEWIKLAFRTILREATVEGVDRVTITPYDKTPMQVGMNKDSAKSLYEKIIPQYFESELAKVNQKLDIKNKNNSIVEKKLNEEYIDLKSVTQKRIKDVSDGWDKSQPTHPDTAEVFRFLHEEDSTLIQRNGSINGEFNRIKFGNFKDKVTDLAEGLPSGNNRNLLVRAVNAKFQQMNHYANMKFSEATRINAVGESAALVDRSIGFDMTEKTKELGKKSRPNFQPSEAFSNFQTERTPTGVLLKNAAGYVISRVGSKYRVYNPYKAVIGVFDSEEQAKKRIYKEEPRR